MQRKDLLRLLTHLALLLSGLALLLTGCGYQKGIIRRETPGPTLTSPDPARYGSLRLVWVREYHKPRGLSTFPDGGKPRDVALYAIVYQHGLDQGKPTDPGREVGRIELEPVRPWDFGNLYQGEFEWLGPDRLAYRQEYGYLTVDKKVAEGELQIPPLP